MDLLSVAVRFTSTGEDAVRASMANVRKDAQVTGEAIPQALGGAKNEFGDLAKAVNHVGNEFGLGLNRGLAMAGKGLGEAAQAAQAYIVQARAAASATTLLAQAQALAAGTARALSGVLAAFGGVIGVTLIGGLLLLNKLTGDWADKAKAAEDGYDAVEKATQKLWEMQTTAYNGWVATAIAVQNATNALDAYRRGGEKALEAQKGWTEAFAAARAQWEANHKNLKKLTDQELIDNAEFVQMLEQQIVLLRKKNELTGLQTAAATKKEAQAGQAEVNAALQTQLAKNRKMMQDQLTATRDVKEQENAAVSEAATRRVNRENKEIQDLTKMWADYDAETDRLNEKAFADKMAKIAGYANDVARALSDGLTSAIDAAIQGKNPLAALGSIILSGFGDILIGIGTSAVASSVFITAIATALAGLDGAGLGLAGLGLIALGGLLKGVGGAIGRSGGVGGGSGSGNYGGSPSGSYQQVLFGQPSTGVAAGYPAPSHIQMTIIGPNDPSAQRTISELVMKASRRGLLPVGA